MPTAFTTRLRRNLLMCGGAAGAWSFLLIGGAAAQPAGTGSGWTAIPPAAPAPPASAPSAGAPGNVQDGLTLPKVPPATELAPTPPPTDSTTPAAGTAAAPTQSEPVTLDHPTVIDTAKLKSGDTTVSLFGIEGVQGQAADGLRAFLASTDGHMTCQSESGSGFVCLLSDGTDVAQVALVNGAARTTAEAPEAYSAQEAAAQAARRGIWANLPAPPAALAHPEVRDTATLVVNGQTYALAGVRGLGSPYAAELHSYIAQNGDSVTCNPQGAADQFVCLLPNGTDVALVALTNGGAMVTQDAPDTYRAAQMEALNGKRGYWLNPPKDIVYVSTPAPAAAVGGCTTVATSTAGAPVGAVATGAPVTTGAADPVAAGITYVGGAPTILIGGAAVFLVFAPELGWGYYDHWHHWYGAPDRYRAYLDHTHPYGRGLPGYHGGEAMVHPGVHSVSESVGHVTINQGVAHPYGGAAPGAHPAGAYPGGPHPATVGAPGRTGTPPVTHAAAGSGFHPGAPGGGFTRPPPSAAGFHPGAAAPHGAPAPHAAPPPHQGGHSPEGKHP